MRIGLKGAGVVLVLNVDAPDVVVGVVERVTLETERLACDLADDLIELVVDVLRGVTARVGDGNPVAHSVVRIASGEGGCGNVTNYEYDPANGNLLRIEYPIVTAGVLGLTTAGGGGWRFDSITGEFIGDE